MVTKKKKKKKASLSADDKLRAFITVHVAEACGNDMPASERANLVDGIAEVFGPVIVSTIQAAILTMTAEIEDDEEEEDEDEEEDDEDEYDDDEEDEDE